VRREELRGREALLVSDNTDWLKLQAAAIAENASRDAAKESKTRRIPMGRAVLLEFRSPSKILTLTSNSDKRAYVLALGPEAEAQSGLAVGDEVLINPESRCLKVGMICADAVDEYLCGDYNQIVLKVERDA
jgi:hypothetical protein